MNIVAACDNDYAQHTAVFLRSLAEHVGKDPSDVFVLVPDDFAHEDAIRRSLDGTTPTINFLRVDVGSVLGLNSCGRFKPTKFLKWCVHKVLPESVTKVLYLDSDIVVTGSLKELWDIDLEGHSVGAVIDPVVNPEVSVREKVGLSATAAYLNSGVLLIDLLRWRAERISDRAVEFVRTNSDRITYQDQDPLNHVLSGRFKKLSPKWNFQTGHLTWDGFRCDSDCMRELSSANIVHFTSPDKPSLYRNKHPLKPLYWQLLRATEWRNYSPPDRTMRAVVIRNLERKSPALLSFIRRLTASARYVLHGMRGTRG